MQPIDPKTQVATQIGLLIIANIEQAAMIEKLRAEAEQRQPAQPMVPPTPTMGKQE